MNRDDLNAAHSAVIRRHWRALNDSGGIPGAGLLGDLYDTAIEFAQDGDRERALADELTRRNRAFDILAREHNQLADELITGLATEQHAKIVVAGLPRCKCGYSLNDGTAPETFIRHVLSVIAVRREDDLPPETEKPLIAPGAVDRKGPIRTGTRRSTPK